MSHPSQEDHGDIVIAIIGNQDARQYDFISSATPHASPATSKTLTATRCSHEGGRPYVLLNLPPLSDRCSGEIPNNIQDVIATTRERLKESYINRVKISGFIFLHDITTLVSFHPLQTLLFFREISRDEALSDITAFVTMGWEGDASTLDSDEREAEENWTKDFRNYKYTRFANSPESAWGIIQGTVRKSVTSGGIPRGNLRIQTKDITSSDRVILVTGISGSGKSTFINKATLGTARLPEGSSLESQNAKNGVVRFPHPPSMQPYVLVEAHGFDETTISLEDFTLMWSKRHLDNARISGTIYLHPILETRLRECVLSRDSIHQRTAPSVVVVTMWEATRGNHDKREILKQFFDGKLDVLTFGNTFKSAWDIIDKVSPPDRESQSGKIWEGTQKGLLDEVIDEFWTWVEYYHKGLRELFHSARM